MGVTCCVFYRGTIDSSLALEELGELEWLPKQEHEMTVLKVDLYPLTPKLLFCMMVDTKLIPMSSLTPNSRNTNYASDPRWPWLLLQYLLNATGGKRNYD